MSGHLHVDDRKFPKHACNTIVRRTYVKAEIRSEGRVSSCWNLVLAAVGCCWLQLLGCGSRRGRAARQWRHHDVGRRSSGTRSRRQRRTETIGRELLLLLRSRNGRRSFALGDRHERRRRNELGLWRGTRVKWWRRRGRNDSVIQRRTAVDKTVAHLREGRENVGTLQYSVRKTDATATCT